MYILRSILNMLSKAKDKNKVVLAIAFAKRLTHYLC